MCVCVCFAKGVSLFPAPILGPSDPKSFTYFFSSSATCDYRSIFIELLARHFAIVLKNKSFELGVGTEVGSRPQLKYDDNDHDDDVTVKMSTMTRDHR